MKDVIVFFITEKKKQEKKQRTAKVPKYKFRIGQEQLPGYWCFWRQRVCWKERNSFIRVLQDFPRKEAEILLKKEEGEGGGKEGGG